MYRQNKGLRILSTLALIVVVAAVCSVITYFICNARNSFYYTDFTAEENKTILAQFGLDYSSKTAITAAIWQEGEPLTIYIKTDMDADKFMSHLNYNIYKRSMVKELKERNPNIIYLEHCLVNPFAEEDKIKESYNVWYQYSDLDGEGLITLRRAFAIDRSKDAGEKIKTTIFQPKSSTPQQKIKLILNSLKYMTISNI